MRRPSRLLILRQLSPLNGELFRTFGREVGLQDRAIDEIFTDLRRRVKKAELILQPPQGEEADGFVTRYAEIVSNACLRILGA